MPRAALIVSLAQGLAIVTIAATVHGQPRHDPSGRQSRAERLRAMGQAYMAAGDLGSAAAYFRDAIQTNPDDPRAYEALGEIYLTRGVVRDAVDVFSAGLRRREDSSALWRGLARALEESGNRDDAARALRTLLLMHPDDVDGHVARADLARRRGAWSEALASYRAILDIAARGASVDGELRSEAARFVSALERLTAGLDPVRGSVQCTSQHDLAQRVVRRALAECELMDAR